MPVSWTRRRARGRHRRIQAARRDDTKNQVMIAALSSANCLALAPVAEQLEVADGRLELRHAPALPRSGNTNTVYRPTATPSRNSWPMRPICLRRKPNVKTVAIINPDYAFGHDAAQIFKAALKRSSRTSRWSPNSSQARLAELSDRNLAPGDEPART